jgi:cytoskeletal protein CcmA (bactofilin family)
MWKEKKPMAAPPAYPAPLLPPERATEEKPMVDTLKSSAVIPGNSGQSVLGRSLVFKGDLSATEDLLIAGQYEGTINVQGDCVTVGPEGKVTADIQAARVVIHGSVHGNISVRERVEVHKTGHVVGDLVTPGISIEDGAYFKGKIEILRDGEPESLQRLASVHAKEAAVSSL